MYLTILATVQTRCRSSGAWIFDFGIPLQQDSDRPLFAQCLLGGGDRSRPGDGDRRDVTGNMTTLRTGTMISASDGIPTSASRAAVDGLVSSESSSWPLTPTLRGETRRIHWRRSG